MMKATSLRVGRTVEIRIPEGHVLNRTAWWPKSGKVTATVQKVFRNGKVALAIHQIRNSSADGCHTLNWSSLEYLHPAD